MSGRTFLSDLVRTKKPYTNKQLAKVRRWLADDWESSDIDRELIALIERLVATVELRTSMLALEKARPKAKRR